MEKAYTRFVYTLAGDRAERHTHTHNAKQQLWGWLGRNYLLIWHLWNVKRKTSECI